MKHIIVISPFDKITNLKCDIPTCKGMAFFMFRTLQENTKRIALAKTRDVIVCPGHKNMLLREGEGKENFEQIPFAFNSEKKQVKCMRCSKIWTPYSFREKNLKNEKYMQLSGWCAGCRSKGWKWNSEPAFVRQEEEIAHV